MVEKIFDPYFSTKQEGSGLGLAIAQSIVGKHSGRISAESSPGAGSTFTIHLPIQVMLDARELAVGLIRGRLARLYPDLAPRELNLKLLEELERAQQTKPGP